MSDIETTIQPALTAEQWRDALRDRAGMAAAMQRAWGDGNHRENDHALAALALVLRPFGFTQEEREALKRAIAVLGYHPDEWRTQRGLESALAKVAALLPAPR